MLSSWNWPGATQLQDILSKPKLLIASHLVSFWLSNMVSDKVISNKEYT